MRSAALTFAVIVALSLASCSRPSSHDRAEVTAEDLQAARQAMPLSEVSLMLRSGYNQQAIIKQVEQRHIPTKLDARTEESLLRFGAKPALIQALKSDANALTRNQRQAFNELAAEKETRTQEQRAAAQSQAESEQAAQAAERARKQQLADQTMQVAQSMADRVTLYDQAQREYVSQKSKLEYKIKVQEAYINRQRSKGIPEDRLIEANQTLENYKQELSQLQEPLR